MFSEERLMMELLHSFLLSCDADLTRKHVREQFSWGKKLGIFYTAEKALYIGPWRTLGKSLFSAVLDGNSKAGTLLRAWTTVFPLLKEAGEDFEVDSGLSTGSRTGSPVSSVASDEDCSDAGLEPMQETPTPVSGVGRAQRGFWKGGKAFFGPLPARFAGRGAGVPRGRSARPRVPRRARGIVRAAPGRRATATPPLPATAAGSALQLLRGAAPPRAPCGEPGGPPCTPPPALPAPPPAAASPARPAPPRPAPRRIRQASPAGTAPPCPVPPPRQMLCAGSPPPPTAPRPAPRVRCRSGAAGGGLGATLPAAAGPPALDSPPAPPRGPAACPLRSEGTGPSAGAAELLPALAPATDPSADGTGAESCGRSATPPCPARQSPPRSERSLSESLSPAHPPYGAGSAVGDDNGAKALSDVHAFPVVKSDEAFSPASQVNQAADLRELLPEDAALPEPVQGAVDVGPQHHSHDDPSWAVPLPLSRDVAEDNISFTEAIQWISAEFENLIFPYVIRGLATMMLEPQQVFTFERNWKFLAGQMAVENSHLPRDDPLFGVGVDLLMGRSQYACPDVQAGLSFRVLDSCRYIGISALIKTKLSFSPKEDFLDIAQKPEEAFNEFISRLMHFLKTRVKDITLTMIILEQLARSHANSACQRLLETIPETSTVLEMVQTCAVLNTCDSMVMTPTAASQPAEKRQNDGHETQADIQPSGEQEKEAQKVTPLFFCAQGVGSDHTAETCKAVGHAEPTPSSKTRRRRKRRRRQGDETVSQALEQEQNSLAGVQPSSQV
ncbi:uncharacterized protein LOC134552832 [Prinia subflava]|uniref:uncharacterized protein LOC134552832 n=1 Tax=Prinia subflava TaxID=208062 RepID=UPI002FE2E6C7